MVYKTGNLGDNEMGTKKSVDVVFPLGSLFLEVLSNAAVDFVDIIQV